VTVAWITGGGSGIGRALAQALYQQGARVAISGRRVNVLEETVRDVRQSGGTGEIAAFPCDVANPRAIDQTAAAIERSWNAITLLINNAGVNSYRSVLEAPLEDYEKLFAINCLGPIAAVQRVLPAMQRQGAGTIVNVSSVLGRWGSSSSAAYSVSKYAVAGYTDILRQQLDGSGVHVMGVYPGYIRTSMTQPFVTPGSWKSRAGTSPETMARAILRGIRRGSGEVCYPFYVSWMVRFHRWFPSWSDRIARALRQRGERAVP
jgi:NAD(P)-dependent dehydrogenase (short-subunit alcohol dehydrogenase family)